MTWLAAEKSSHLHLRYRHRLILKSLKLPFRIGWMITRKQ